MGVNAFVMRKVAKVALLFKKMQKSSLGIPSSIIILKMAHSLMEALFCICHKHPSLVW